MLFWPLTNAEFGISAIKINSTLNIATELSLFILAMLLLLKTGDFKQFIHPAKSSIVLAIPIITVLLPSVVSYPLEVPLLMLPPHIVFLSLFSVTIIAVFHNFSKLIHSKLRKGSESSN
jgi:hypothetical protein